MTHHLFINYIHLLDFGTLCYICDFFHVYKKNTSHRVGENISKLNVTESVQTENESNFFIDHLKICEEKPNKQQ